MQWKTVRIIGIIVSILGILNLFEAWFNADFFIMSGGSYHLVHHYSYDGMSIITSGVFTNWDSYYYRPSGRFGLIVPVIISLLFSMIFIRFVVKIDRPYAKDVGIICLLILLASFYMISWVSPGSSDTDTGYEAHSFGSGPTTAIVLLIICEALAYIMDRKIREMDTIPYAVPALNGYAMASDGDFIFYCPSCGKGMTEDEITDLRFCKHCGYDVSKHLNIKEKNDGIYKI